MAEQDARRDSGAVVDLRAVAERLTEEHDEVTARLSSLTADLESLFAASADSNADDEHDPEGQTIAYERSQLSSLIEAARGHLARIDSTSARVRLGTYGLCEFCGQPIPAARLEARPTATSCVQHAAGAGRTSSYPHQPGGSA